MKIAEIVKNKFDINKFKMSMLVWLFSYILSLCPLVFSYLHNYANNSAPRSFLHYLLLQPDLMYACVSSMAVVSADVIQETFINKKLKSGLVFSFLFQLIIIVFGVAGYTMIKFTPGSYDFMLTLNVFYVLLVIVVCLYTYIYINIRS